MAADAGTFGLSGSSGHPQVPPNASGFSIGDSVRVRDQRRSPLAGQSGKIAEITPGDACGPYLVQFGNGLQFRYRGDELAALTT